MGGKWDCARDDAPCWEAGYNADPGCGGSSCHGTLGPSPTTLISISGLPSGGYAPGQTYDVTVQVVGIPIYTLVDNGCRFPVVGLVGGGNALTGFNLEPSAGFLDKTDPDDQTVQIRNETQCYQLGRLTGCGIVPSIGPCPPCDDTQIVGSQATHTIDGINQLTWNLRWTAPDPAVGDVTFYLGGNMVNGNCRADLGDRWALGATLVHQAR